MFKPLTLQCMAILMAAVLLLPSAGAHAQSAFDDPGARGAGGVQGGDLKPVNDKMDAGAVALGASTQVVVLFRNDDSKGLKTGAINLYPSSNISASIGENQCAMDTVQPGEVCAVSIQVKGLQGGKYRIEMLVRHDGRAKLMTATIDGNVEASGDKNEDAVTDLEAIPAEMDFGTLDESRAQAKALILRNKTSKTIEIKNIKVEAGSQSGFSINSNCGELVTGAACVASVTWSPEQKGPASGTIIVEHTGSTGVSTIDLKGSYDPTAAEVANVFPEAIPGKGLLVSSQEDIDFGSGVSQSSSITVSLVNVGDVPLSLTDIHITNSENGVHAEKAGCQTGYMLAPLEACPLTLTWEPVREGNIVDDVQISHTGARGILVMPLRGAATRAVNKDTKAIMLGGNPGPEAILQNIQPLSLNDVEEEGEEVMENGSKATVKKNSGARGGEKKGSLPSAPLTEGTSVAGTSSLPQVDARGILDGYIITSYSAKRAIIAGPGGSRVVFDGEQTVIGGVLWQIVMRPNAVEFQNGPQKVLLLFDKSLSSFNTIRRDLDMNDDDDSSSSSSSSSSTSTSSTP